ncbi:LANO_0C04148g1_1 [Lachancea nothofagi CBS 11611]|uniref:RNA exonuclease 4 n=1 Tax=Lachancea nothofagi CBS 11611 TaxID=1266666 RepID=A0A1G4J726_9SACH|nr:LANO_0C04148g1_1 [Lachancea nothofagi CBS 11611]
MVLSSNWLKLQSSQKPVKPVKPLKPVKSKCVAKAVPNPVQKASTKDKEIKLHKTNKILKSNDRKTATRSKKNIMNMVNSMTHEMDKLEDQKKNILASGNPQSASSADVEQTLQADMADRSLNRASEVGKYVAIDCEFVGVGPDGKDSALARATVVNFFGHVVLDVFVKPQEKVTDWRTWVSGVRPQDMQSAVPFAVAQEQVAKTLENRYLVGHSVTHDLQSLFLSHPRTMIRDTSRHIPFRKKYAGGKTPSLKKLAKEILGLDIQGAEHSPIEDARATMLIYKSDRKEFERLHQIKYGPAK